MSKALRDFSPQTDLACERMRADTDLPGVEYREEEGKGCRISRLSVTSREGAESIGKPEGTYVTMSFPPLFELQDGEIATLSSTLSSLVLEFLARLAPTARSVLAVGLGNRSITSDAVGPESVRAMMATRHLRAESPALFSQLADIDLALLAPGVMGETGIEASDLVAATVRATAPDLVIVIDALAARSTERLAATIQLTDTGIRPGSGIGNARRPLDRSTLGVPVLSIGMPTVVGSATLVLDALEKAELRDGDLPESLRRVLTEGKSFFVSPREADVVTERAARLFSDAVNHAFSSGFFAEN